MTYDFKSAGAKILLGGTAMAVALAFSPISLTQAVGQGQGQRMQGGQGQGGGGQGAGAGGQQGGPSFESRIFRGKGERVIIILEDEDSDRPDWAMGNPELNPHAKAGGGKPTGAGTMKGDLYGDLIVLVRDPETGEPVVENGEYLICLDADCTSTTPTVDGEVPDGVTAIEVDFGRAAIARAPDSVIEKALGDALEKLTLPYVELGVDAAGRITYTYPVDADNDGDYDEDNDGEFDVVVTGTIDSPLENLALYIDLMEGLASNATTPAEGVLGSLATLDTAAALFAGVADKTGDISLDYLYYQNLITGIVPESSTYYDYDGFTYTRSFPTDYSYWVSIDGADPVTMVLNVNDYLTAINGAVPSAGDYADLFATAADDALEVIELMHTQIYTEVLPGTVTP